MDVFYSFLGIAVIIVLVVYLLVLKIGNAKFNLKMEERTPFILEEQTEKSVTVSSRIEFANEGEQCGTIMDCYVRHLLPYEQFDGIKVSSKAELADSPREDDYFEAVLIQKRSSIHIVVKVTLTARRMEDIRVVLAQMVDLPIDVVYQYVARDPWAIDKKRMVLTAEEVANLVGIKLTDQ